MPETTASYDDIAFALRADGFKPGRPKHVSAESAAIDRGVCEESACENCGHVGLLYQPWRHPTKRRYRAVATCPACSSSSEI